MTDLTDVAVMLACVAAWLCLDSFVLRVFG